MISIKLSVFLSILEIIFQIFSIFPNISPNSRNYFLLMDLGHIPEFSGWIWERSIPEFPGQMWDRSLNFQDGFGANPTVFRLDL